MSSSPPVSRDSIGNILRVSLLLCLVCAIGVSVAAVGLKARQDENKRLDMQRNVLVATGLYGPDELTDDKVAAEFLANVHEELVDLKTGKVVAHWTVRDGARVFEKLDPAADVSADYDSRSAAGDAKRQVKVSPDAVKQIGIKVRAPYYPIYSVRNDGALDTVVLPIVGNGLWSTMYGFLALEPDLKTVRGINYYEHGETPGLGGEVENPTWKSQWKGKVAYVDGAPAIDVIKGSVNPEAPNAEHMVDGLAGATITANGVEGTVNYWLGDEGFGQYIEQRRETRQADGSRDEGGESRDSSPRRRFFVDLRPSTFGTRPSTHHGDT